MTDTEWYTPPELVEKLQNAVGGFDLDPASGCEPDPIATCQYNEDDDGLAQDWFGTVFVNPPYSRWDNPRWMEKIAEEGQSERTDLVVALVPANTDTDWWHDHVATADWISLVDGRLQFGGANGSGKFANAIAVWGDEIPDDLLRVMENPTAGTDGNLYSTDRLLAPENFHVGDVWEVTLGKGSMGFPDQVDETARIEILTGKIKNDGLVELLGVQERDIHTEGPEVYYLLSAPLSDLTDIRCSVDHMGGLGWATVPLNEIRPIEVAQPIRLDEVGKGEPTSHLGKYSVDDEGISAEAGGGIEAVVADGGKPETIVPAPCPFHHIQ